MRITIKGQVTIPQSIREKYRFDPLSEIEFKEENGRVYLDRVERHADAVREGPFEYGRGKATVKLSTEQIMRLTRGEE